MKPYRSRRGSGARRVRYGQLASAALLGIFLSGFTFTLETGTVTYSARDAQRSWQGTAPLRSVAVTPAEGELEVTAVLSPGAFNSGNFVRDGNARFTVFEVGEYPTATLSGTLPLDPELLSPQPQSQPHSQPRTAPFTGELTLHGVTNEVTFPVTVVRDGTQVRAEGDFTVQLSAYEMTRPSLFGVVVDDRVDLSVALTGVLTP